MNRKMKNAFWKILTGIVFVSIVLNLYGIAGFVYAKESDIPNQAKFQGKETNALGEVRTASGGKLYVVDHSKWIPEECIYKDTICSADIYENVTFITNSQKQLFLIYMQDAQGELFLYAYQPDANKIYPVDRYGDYNIVSAYACDKWPDELSGEVIATEGVLYAFNKNGGQFAVISDDGIQQWNPKQSLSVQTSNRQMWIVSIFAVGVPLGVLILIGCFIGIRNLVQKKENQRERKRAEQSKDDTYLLDADDENEVRAALATSYLPDIERAYNGEIPVISIRHVTMTFRIVTNTVTKLIDYIEMFFKHKKTYREFDALHDVSFDVYKGEVVGIIGGNGAGKSTLLKIVSGALTPSSGEVIVDRSKVQLLTLGTGFDVEMTGRENVYLNGSLIGYSKEYLDEHFDEIVAFAELGDFIDEKIKNYSSGMISRLGFAIATAGDAAEILILDEVLSVGDEFFRKKSLARIKEMIHGGSTVLMVSHGMGAITENCTKVAWIEKGMLQMIGSIKTVCKAYQNKGK